MKEKNPNQVHRARSGFLRRMIGRTVLPEPEALIDTSVVPPKSEGLPQFSVKNFIRKLEAEGEEPNWIILSVLDTPRFITGLQTYCEKSGDNIEEYLRHSSRYAKLRRGGKTGDLFSGEEVHIPQLGQNWEERGRTMDMQYVRSQNIDPAHVLYFRVTQPMESGKPKPEYYWTSDLGEVSRGLNLELGAQAQTAVILTSTLEDIASNGGLIDDINDDSGIPVRQIGTEPYDQGRALFVMPRQHYVTSSNPFGAR